jgi:hypothetical protein
LAAVDIAKVTNIFLKLDLDFEVKILKGYVVLSVQKIDPDASLVVRTDFHDVFQFIINQPQFYKLL